jgi:hypothetical protein
MELVKASASKPASAVEAAQRTQRTQRNTPSEAQPDAAASRKAEAEKALRATTNTRGETLGQLLNVRA